MLQFYALQILGILSYAVTFITAWFIVMDDSKRSESIIAWLLFIFIFRWIGVFIYILFGLNWKKGNLVRQHPEKLFGEFLEDALKRQQKYFDDQFPDDVPEDSSDMLKVIRMLIGGNNSMLTVNNDVKLFEDGWKVFSSLLDDLKAARNSIHMEFYIWRSDELGEKIKDVLLERAAAGIDVKLIFDGLGSFRKISRKYRNELKRGGVKFSYFLDLNIFQDRMKINYRNHRKIVVIDGSVAYTGGMNIGEEYISGGDMFKTWRDTAIRLTGDSVRILQALFLVDWASSGNSLTMSRELFPSITEETPLKVPVQVAFSGPDSQWPNIEQVFFQMIANANNEIWIQSPYFVPSSNILMAMRTSALSGVKVNLMMTGVPDKRIPFWTAESYFESLLSAGVKIYQYQAGFLHSKFLVSDSLYSTIGSCNMDMRSFHINFEVNAVIYDDGLAEELVNRFELDREQCREITLEEVKSFGHPRRLRNSVLRLFSGVL